MLSFQLPLAQLPSPVQGSLSMALQRDEAHYDPDPLFERVHAEDRYTAVTALRERELAAAYLATHPSASVGSAEGASDASHSAPTVIFDLSPVSYGLSAANLDASPDAIHANGWTPSVDLAYALDNCSLIHAFKHHLDLCNDGRSVAALAASPGLTYEDLEALSITPLHPTDGFGHIHDHGSTSHQAIPTHETSNATPPTVAPQTCVPSDLFVPPDVDHNTLLSLMSAFSDGATGFDTAAPPSRTSPTPSPDPREDDAAGDVYDTPSPTQSSSASTSSCTPSPSSTPPRTLRKCKKSPRRRNKPVPAGTPGAARANPWRCPHCAFVQRGRRTPDLKRHIRTHTRPSDPLWVCCGVPLADAAARGVPPDVLRRQTPFEYEGVLFVGGCEREFSRRDALKRHLSKCRGECVGDACAPYLLGNKIGAR